MTSTLPIDPQTRAHVVPAARRTTASSRVRAQVPWRHLLLMAGDAGLAVAVAAAIDALPAVAAPPWPAALTGALWLGLLTAASRYRRSLLPTERPGVAGLARASLGLVVVGLVLAAVTRADLDAADLLLLVTATASASGLWGTAVTAGTARRDPRGIPVVVVGHPHRVAEVVTSNRNDKSPFTVVAACVHPHPGEPGGGQPLEDGTGPAVCTDLREVPSLVSWHGARAVLAFPDPHLDGAALRRLGWQLEGTGTQLLVGTALPDIGLARVSLHRAGQVPLLQVRPAQLRGAGRVLKEVWERTAAAVALVLLAPLLGLLAVLIRLESSGPALFTQTRVGRDGLPFTMLKLRTMTQDAEDRLATLSAMTPAGQVLFKMVDDPRITRVGRVLRRYSLDELPQLINVVRGEMALVGPRPPLPSEVAQYDGDTHRRLVVAPGLTGLWQVSGRADLSWEESVRLDLSYVENWSLRLDAHILLRTVGAVLGHRGAY